MKKNEEGGPLDVVPPGCFTSGNPCTQAGPERVVVKQVVDSDACDDTHLSDIHAVRGSPAYYKSLDQIRQGLVVR